MAYTVSADIRDTGTGTLTGNTPGMVNYAAGTLTFSPDKTARVPLPAFANSKIGSAVTGGTVEETWRRTYTGYRWVDAPAVFLAGQVKVRYFTANSGDARSKTVIFQPEIDITAGHNEHIAAGSVVLDFAGTTCADASGALLFGVLASSGAGTRMGVIDYDTGKVPLQAWPALATNSGTVQACMTLAGVQPVDGVHFTTASAPVRPASLVMRYNLVGDAGVQVVRAAQDGTITGDGVEGYIDVRTGVVRLRFGRWVTVTDAVRAEPWYREEMVKNGRIWQAEDVDASTILYAAVAYSYIPLNKDIIGVDTVRLPIDGQVPIFRAGDVAVVHHAQSAALEAQANATANCGRGNLSRVWVYDEGNTAGGTIPGGVRVPSDQYDANLDTGIVTLTDTTGLVGPLRVEHRIEDVVMISDAQVTGELSFSRPLAHDFPAGSGVSSALIAGDLFARATQPFDQRSWTDEWSDARIGNQVSAEYNSTLYPIEVDNTGAITERWALIFTNTSTVRVVGEASGQIESGLPIASDIAPINPVTNRPYFRVRKEGFGSGWATGNVIRFNTIGAQAPVWIARTVQQGLGIEGADGFRVQIRGDIDAQP